MLQIKNRNIILTRGDTGKIQLQLHDGTGEHGVTE